MKNVQGRKASARGRPQKRAGTFVQHAGPFTHPPNPGRIRAAADIDARRFTNTPAVTRIRAAFHESAGRSSRSAARGRRSRARDDDRGRRSTNARAVPPTRTPFMKGAANGCAARDVPRVRVRFWRTHAPTWQTGARFAPIRRVSHEHAAYFTNAPRISRTRPAFVIGAAEGYPAPGSGERAGGSVERASPSHERAAHREDARRSGERAGASESIEQVEESELTAEAQRTQRSEEQ